MPEDLLEEMDARIASLRMSRTEYLKTWFALIYMLGLNS
jgi:hypothetical protein